ncbi:RodZ domain-containing protein [uncultured Mitsuokella sp.]|uniref:helix-turn-helix domain-containing protein n=1 Tax=uncultured Mitsuokella sp. TaxID=453120 RepID=UPI0025D6C706|nr:RodZ domain-containing protein [uncultured Mitsuokella sp.]
MLGDKLREAREQQNLTYKDIEKGTSIRALYIEYIENGNYDELPGDVYTKGFIRSYANFLKLNPNELVQEFIAERRGGAAPSAAPSAPQTQDPAAPAHPTRQETQPAVKPAAPAPKAAAPKAPAEFAPKAEQPAPKAAPKAEPQQAPARPARQQRPEPQAQPSAKPALQPEAVKTAAPKKRPARSEKPAAKYDFDEPKRSNTKLIAIVAFILVVLAGAAYALSGSDDSASKAPAQQQTQQAAPEPKTYDDVEVTATFSADCWLEVKADGKTIYEGTLKKGDSQTWKGQDKVTVRVGDAGAVSFSVNGKDLGKAGKDGQVANKTFTKDGNN